MAIRIRTLPAIVQLPLIFITANLREGGIEINAPDSSVGCKARLTSVCFMLKSSSTAQTHAKETHVQRGRNTSCMT